MLGWFVCPTVSMVTTGKTISLGKTIAGGPPFGKQVDYNVNPTDWSNLSLTSRASTCIHIC